MREIYSNDLNVLDYHISVRGNALAPSSLPVAELYVSSSSDFPILGVILDVEEKEPGYYQVIIPIGLVKNKRFAKVNFRYVLAGHGEVVDTDVYEVTQRLISFEEYNENLGFDSTGDSLAVSWELFNKTEKISRNIIESFCNQKFNCWEGSIVIYGAIGSVQLPQHIERFDNILGGDVEFDFDLNTDTGLSTLYQPSENGFFLRKTTKWRKPSVTNRPDPQNSLMTIKGLWGYSTIPSQVKEATLELMRYLMSDEAEDRRRYLVNMNHADDSSGAFNFSAYRDSTGNPLTDDLLTDYRVFIMGAI